MLCRSDDWSSTSNNLESTEDVRQPRVDDGGGGMQPQIETDQKSVNSQEDEEEEEIAPRRPMRLASESEKQKEHLNIVFIGHVGKCHNTFLP